MVKPIGLLLIAAAGVLLLLDAPAAAADDKHEAKIKAVEQQMKEVRDRMQEVRANGELDDKADAQLMKLMTKYREMLKKRNELRVIQQRARWKRAADRERRPRRNRHPVRVEVNEPKLTEVDIVRTDVNQRDGAHFEIATILCKAEKYDEAIAELTEVVDESPDDEAVGAAQFSIANICRRRLGDANKAVEHYSHVTGELQPEAFEAMIETLEEIGEIDQAEDIIQKMIDNADDKETKIGLLYGLARMLNKNGKSDEAITVLRRIPGLISYEEAGKMHKKPTAPGGDKHSKLSTTPPRPAIGIHPHNRGHRPEKTAKAQVQVKLKKGNIARQADELKIEPPQPHKPIEPKDDE